MKQTLLILGAGALVAVAAPAAAKPGNGHGKSNHSGMSHKGLNHENHGKGTLYGYGQGGCPPGLSKHEGHCMPHGQFKKMYKVGQRYNTRYGNMWSYDQIPFELRNQYGFQPNYNYYYGNGYLYQVDPRTQLINNVVSALLR